MYALTFTDGTTIYSVDAPSHECMASVRDALTSKLNIPWNCIRNLSWSIVSVEDAINLIPKKWKNHSVIHVII